MTTTMKTHLSLLLAAALLVSCDGFSTAIVDVDPVVDDMTHVLVINAEIEKGKIAWAQVSYTEDIDALVTTPVKYENAATVTLSVDDGKSEVLKLVTNASTTSDGGVGTMSNGNDSGADQGAADQGAADQGAAADSGQADAGVDLGSTPDAGVAPDTGATPDAGKGKPDAGKGKPDAGKGTNPYANKGLYIGSTIKGEEGRTYTLTVKLGDDTYVAKHYMFKEPGIAWLAINGYTSGGVETDYSITSDAKGKAGGYSEEWKVLDPAATRDRYLFEWYTNGVHDVRRDWVIDDNRVVNSKKDGVTNEEGLKLFNPTINPSANQHIGFRAAEVDKPTYDYFNMYEKIARGLIGVGSVTPYNPKSNFVGKRTVGNFRAVSFSYVAAPIPPTPCTIVKGGTVTIQFASSPLMSDNKTAYFTKYHLYSSTATGVDYKSTKQEITPTTKDSTTMLYTVTSPASGANYFRLQVEDKDGYLSPLSPEVTADTTKDLDNCKSGGTTPTTPCGDLKKACDPKKDKACLGKDKKVYECTGKGVWTEQKVGSMTCGGVTKQCLSQKAGWCMDANKDWWTCKDGKWSKYSGGK